MHPSVFSFRAEQFDRIFPFYILMDRELKISSFGRLIAKLGLLQEARLFTECVEVKPAGTEISFNSLRQLNGQIVFLVFKNSPENVLRGQFEYLEDSGQLLFIGNPYFEPEENSKGHDRAVIDISMLSIPGEKDDQPVNGASDEVHKAKEIFLANMSHEIRTPMTGILGITNLLAKTGLNEQQRKFTKLISESASNLLTIVNDVLDIEKITAGKLDLEFIPFKIEDKVFTTLQSFQFKAEDKDLNLSLNSNLPDDLIVIGDPYRLSQILNNLLSNALKFTNDGEISINIDSRDSDDSSLTIDFQVADTGIGINEDRLPEIFNPFVQASTDTTRKFGGTGLGLTICKNLVEMQGGKITVDSKLNEGTAFSFYIRYEKGDETLLPDENKEELNYKDLESVRILVAEDVELNQFLIRNILEGWGCDVTIVNNGNEAVEKVKRHYYDLILMDIQMPEMDGITATKMIRRLNTMKKSSVQKLVATKKIRTLNTKQNSEIPIIALTAYALKGDGQRYLSIGMNGYITKPYTEEKLFQVINQVLKANNNAQLSLPANIQTDGTPVEKNNRLFDMSLVAGMSKGDVDFVKKVIEIFVDTMPGNLESLVRATNEKNYEEVSITAHKMKSNIDLLEVSSLKIPIRALESNELEDEEREMLVGKVKNVLTEVLEQLRKFN